MSRPSRIDDAKLGAFVLVALVLLTAGSLWLAGSSAFGVRQIGYRVLMTDSAGLAAGDRVRMAGVAVGRIRQVELRQDDPWPVALEIGVRPGIALHADGEASIKTAGLIGSAHLEIDPGSSGAPLLGPGGEIHGKSSMGMDQALERVGGLADAAGDVLAKTSGILDQVSVEIGPILGNLEQVLSEENGRNLSGLLANLRQLSDEASPRLIEMTGRLESLAGHLDRGAEELPELTARISTLIDSLHAGLGEDGARLSALLDTANGTLGSAEEVMGTVRRNRSELEATLQDLRDTVANLRDFSQQVKERPFSLVRIKTPPKRTPGQGVNGGGR